jgi:hypothetical protein
MNKPLEQRLREAFPSLTDADFGHHSSDLYVVAHPGVWEWLQKNHTHPNQITTFPGSGDWTGKTGIDIPFAGNWPN